MKNLLVLFGFAMAAVSFGQSPDMEWFKQMDMRHIGPGTMSGRVTAIDVVRDRPEIIYVGTASGGLWKSSTAGTTWEAVFDEAPVQSIGALCIDPSNPDVIWAGTGEGNPRNSVSSGGGIFKSIDGGKNWTLMGLEATKAIHRIIVHPHNSDVVWVAAHGAPWGPSLDRGVFKTEDGGRTWTKVLYSNELSGCAEMIADPVNPNKLFAALYEHERKPWTFQSGGEGSGLYLSYDGGENWKELSGKKGLPEKPYGRIGLANSAANPQMVYALIESKKTGLYKSTDGGENWSLVATENIGNRPFYYAEIHGHPGNENTLFNLYSLLSKSIDGGKNFEVILPYSGVHPDHHAFYIHPDDHRFMINGNDGGLNISRDGGSTWQYITNLPVGQFYHIDFDLQVPYNVYGGMQDNGSWQGPAYVWQSGGVRNEHWQELYFGDGFDVLPNGFGEVYAMSQGGNIARINLQSGAKTSIKPVHPDGQALRFNWNAALAADPHNPEGLFFGSQFVHHSTDRGESWEILSPDLTSNDPEKQKQAESGGLTIDATQAENHTTILCIAPSPHNADVIWVGTDDGKVQLTQNGGELWENLVPKLKGLPEGAWIPQITLSPYQAGEAFVVANDYRRNNWETYLYHTTDFGKSWKRLADGKQVKGHALSVVQDPIEEKLLFLGTENGLWVSFDKGLNWQQWSHDYPSVSTMDLKIHPREHDLIIGTFGRGCYILDDIRPLRRFAAAAAESSPTMFMTDAGMAYLHHWKRPPGARFVADHHWSGANKRSGAAFSYFIHPDSLDAKEKETKAELRVFNEAGDTLRTLRFEPDSAVNRFSWDLREQGVRSISRKAPKEDELYGGGPMVVPGSYRLEMTYKGMKASATVQVGPAPGLPFDLADMQEARSFHRRCEEAMKTAATAFDELMEARRTIKEVKRIYSFQNEDDEEQKGFLANADSLLNDIKAFDEEVFLPEDFKGYDHVTMRLSNVLWRAYGMAPDFEQQPGANAMIALEQAREASDEFARRTKVFLEGPYQDFLDGLANQSLKDLIGPKD